MFGKKRFIEVILIVLVVLVLNAFRTVTVRADEATPPPTATPVLTQPVEDGSAGGTDVAPTDTATPVPTEAAVTQAASTDTSTPVDTSTATPAPMQASGGLAPTLTNATTLLVPRLTHGTRLVLVSADQPAVPLGSTEAANIIKTGDPIWCPSGVTPKANTGGCTGLYTNFDGSGGLLQALSGKATAGTIWIESSYDSSLDSSGVVLNSTTVGLYPTIVNYALTMQGGWSGTLGTTTISGNSTFGVPLTIAWNADVNLNNLSVTGVTSGTALDVTTPKNITLTGVNVNTNTGAAGAYLDNTSGSGSVTITSSQFNNNSGGNGLEVHSRGSIALSAITAEDNSGIGADLENSPASSPVNVTLTSGPYEFDKNVGGGLQILSTGAISLKDIDALDNLWGNGAYLNNTFSSTAQPITLTGTNVFSEDGTSGLEIHSSGAISANNLVTNFNPNYWGAILDNSLAASAQPVTLTGSSNQFDNNRYGLYVASKGNITLNSITASYNSGDPGSGDPYPPTFAEYPSGAELDNCLYNSGTQKCMGTGNVTLTGTNSFENNYRSGLMTLSAGTITINNLSADGNGHDTVTPTNSNGDGAALFNFQVATPKSITLTGTNSFSNNYDDGLLVGSLGAIAVNNVTASGNEIWDGAYLINTYTSSVGSFTLSGTNIFDKNGGDGLDAESNGTMSVSNLDAESNGSYGARLLNSTASTPQSVTLTGFATLFSNGQVGLDVLSMGAISVNNMNEGGSDTTGALLDNHTAATPQPVTLNGETYIWTNSGDGLDVNSKGTIIISGLWVDSWNTGNGAVLDNNFAGSAGNVSVTGLSLSQWWGFSFNAKDGLDINSLGAVSATNLFVTNNGGTGLLIDNHTAATPQSVTLTGSNQINQNGGDGLDVFSAGAISVSNMNEYQSGGIGVLLDNHTAKAPQPVTLSGSTYINNNVGDGLDVNSKGAITISDIWQAAGNGGNGAVLDNSFAGSVGNVSVIAPNSYPWGFSNNTKNGLDITSLGIIAVSNLNDFQNDGTGAVLDNSTALKPQSVTLTGYTQLNQIGGDGLDIISAGTISVSNLNEYQSGGTGARFDNHTATAPQTVTLTGSTSLNQNVGDGLEVISVGAISVSNLNANNDATGAMLDNHTAKTSQSVTLIGYPQFNQNSGDGLDVISVGAISVSNLNENQSGDTGARFDNHTATTPQSVTLTGNNNLNQNSADGLDVLSVGAISVSNLNANNDATGALLNNSGAATPQSVTLTGGTSTSNNTGDGLDVNSKGAITISTDWSAGGNGNNGAVLDNAFAGAAGTVSVTVPFSITTWGFSNNKKDGLDITSVGAILVNNLIAKSNSGNGALLDNTSAATPQSVTVSGINMVNGNTGDGLTVKSKGAISLGNTDVEGNNGYGALLDNSSAVTPQPVSISLSGPRDWFGNNSGGNGLEIQTQGAVTIANLNAGGNSGDGALINNQFQVTQPQNVTLTGFGEFNNNGDSGLAIISYGTITGNNLTASGNGGNNGDFGWGAYLDNCGYDDSGSNPICPSTLAKGITLTGTNIFNNNYHQGLWATTKGPIQVNGLIANGNGWAGARLDNQWGAGSSGSITLTGSNTFLNNLIAGLKVISNGAISVNNLTANGNASDGVDLNTHSLTTTPQNVTITGSNTFLNNGTDGLNVSADGNLTVSGVTADENSGVGVNGATGGTITVLGGSITGNTSYGWQFSANPTVTLKGVFAYGNNGWVSPENNLLSGTLVIVRTYP